MKKAYLSFDDGPNPPYTSKILDILKRHKIKATFFLLGYNVKLHLRTALRIKKQGHTIGSHSFSHKHLTKLNKKRIIEEIEKTEKVFRKVLDIKPALFRPPYGEYNKKIANILKQKGYKIMGWDIDAEDWKGYSTDIIVKSIIDNTKDKDIILLHDGSNIRQRKSRQRTVNALPKIIKGLRQRGFIC